MRWLLGDYTKCICLFTMIGSGGRWIEFKGFIVRTRGRWSLTQHEILTKESTALHFLTFFPFMLACLIFASWCFSICGVVLAQCWVVCTIYYWWNLRKGFEALFKKLGAPCHFFFWAFLCLSLTLGWRENHLLFGNIHISSLNLNHN